MNQHSNPTVVYLDQSDWAYLQAGRFPEVESKLRRFGANGVQFPVSSAHLAETLPLKRSSRRRRIRYFAEFPGAHLLTSDALTSWSEEVKALVTGRATDTSPSLIPLNTLTSRSLRQHLNRARLLRPLAWLDYKRARGEADSLRGEKKSTRLKAATAAMEWIHGNPVPLREGMIARGEILGWRAALVMQLIARFALQNRENLLAEAIIPPRGTPIDWFIQHRLTSLWPEEVPKTAAAAAQAYENWSRRRIELAPRLALQAAVFDHCRDSGKLVTLSDAFDAFHASSGVVADVFTCDKNKHQVLSEHRNVLGRDHSFRTADLGRVVDFLDAHGSTRFSRAEEGVPAARHWPTRPPFRLP